MKGRERCDEAGLFLEWRCGGFSTSSFVEEGVMHWVVLVSHSIAWRLV